MSDFPIPDRLKIAAREGHGRVILSFCVSGHVKQIVQLTDPDMTAALLLQGLKDGTISTTIQEGGTVEYVEDGKVVGTVASVDNECEYTDFQLEASP